MPSTFFYTSFYPIFSLDLSSTGAQNKIEKECVKKRNREKSKERVR
jgi:hypothetical protein